MPIEPRPASREAGFTLIEVLIAMVILAVGLLSLEALGIVAARSVARAEKQSQYAMLASDSLESALHQIRGKALPDAFCLTLPNGDQLSRRVDNADPNRLVVGVRVIPNPSGVAASAGEFRLSSAVFSPTPLNTTVNGQACP